MLLSEYAETELTDFCTMFNPVWINDKRNLNVLTTLFLKEHFSEINNPEI